MDAVAERDVTVGQGATRHEEHRVLDERHLATPPAVQGRDTGARPLGDGLHRHRCIAPFRQQIAHGGEDRPGDGLVTRSTDASAMPWVGARGADVHLTDHNRNSVNVMSVRPQQGSGTTRARGRDGHRRGQRIGHEHGVVLSDVRGDVRHRRRRRRRSGRADPARQAARRQQGLLVHEGTELPRAAPQSRPPAGTDRADCRRWRTSTWDASIRDIATRMRRIVDEHGPDAMAHFVGSPGGANVLAPMFRGAPCGRPWVAAHVRHRHLRHDEQVPRERRDVRLADAARVSRRDPDRVPDGGRRQPRGVGQHAVPPAGRGPSVQVRRVPRWACRVREPRGASRARRSASTSSSDRTRICSSWPRSAGRSS